MNNTHDPKEIEHILLKRAEKAAQIPTREVEASEQVRIVVFRIGEERFGIRIENLSKIVPCPHITRLPDLPSVISGITQIRGELLAVCSLVDWLMIKAYRLAYLAVVEGSLGQLGLLFDEILGFQDVQNLDIAQSFCSTSSDYSHFIEGLTKDLITLLDVEKLMHHARLHVNAEFMQS
ncbi:chemotaxis protein CheW [bacterium]|nr:chemotaxis protein CheW [bacterium]